MYEIINDTIYKDGEKMSIEDIFNDLQILMKIKSLSEAGGIL